MSLGLPYRVSTFAPGYKGSERLTRPRDSQWPNKTLTSIPPLFVPSRYSHHCLPKILAICSNMVQLFENKPPAGSSVIWKTTYAEREWLRPEVSSRVM